MFAGILPDFNYFQASVRKQVFTHSNCLITLCFRFPVSLFAKSPLDAIVSVGKHRLTWDFGPSPLQVLDQGSTGETKNLVSNGLGLGLSLGCIAENCLALLSKHLKEEGISIDRCHH